MNGTYDRIVKKFGATRLGTWFFITLGTVIDRRLIRWSGGKLSSGSGTSMHEHAVLLYAKGARTGAERCVPLIASFNGEDIILIASRGGHKHNPNWYHNLKANPQCAIEHAGNRSERIAYEAEGEERRPLWQLAVDTYDGFGNYEERTNRTIPVMVLRPTPSST